MGREARDAYRTFTVEESKGNDRKSRYLSRLCPFGVDFEGRPRRSQSDTIASRSSEILTMTPARRGMGLLACLLGFMASPAISADVSAWNGEVSPARGRGWAQPETTKIAASKDQAKSDATLLRIDLPGSGWRGVGWNWFG